MEKICPTEYCVINFNLEASGTTSPRAKREKKMTFEQDLERENWTVDPDGLRSGFLGHTARKNKSYGRENKPTCCFSQ